MTFFLSQTVYDPAANRESWIAYKPCWAHAAVNTDTKCGTGQSLMESQSRPYEKKNIWLCQVCWTEPSWLYSLFPLWWRKLPCSWLSEETSTPGKVELVPSMGLTVTGPLLYQPDTCHTGESDKQSVVKAYTKTQDKVTENQRTEMNKAYIQCTISKNEHQAHWEKSSYPVLFKCLSSQCFVGHGNLSEHDWLTLEKKVPPWHHC